MIEGIVELEDHKEEIKILNSKLKKIKSEYKSLIETKNFNLNILEKYQAIVKNMLMVVGELSISRFDALHPIEDYYIVKFKNNPELGKELFLKEYKKLHKPYDKIKNQCYGLLDDLEAKKNAIAKN